MTGQTLKPDSEDQAREAVAWAVSEEAPLELIGRASKRRYGRPMQTSHTLDLSGIAGITLYEPEELVMGAGPGTPIAEVEAELARHNQQLAFEPPDLGPLLGGAAEAGTLGGAVACNLSGPRRVKAGAARDHLLGLRGVNGRAEAFKTGGRVVKNVTGYDLCKLMTGSFGTLSAMTHLTLKVLPAPEATKTVVITGLDETTAMAAMTQAMTSPHEVSGAAHLPGTLAGSLQPALEGPVTLIRVEGFGPSVDHRAQALADLLGGDARILAGEEALAPWRGVRDVRPFWGDERPVWRISVAPQAGPDLVARIAESEAVEASYDWAGGLVWLRLDRPAGDAVRAAVDAVGGGHATLVRAGEAERAALPVFQPQPEALAALTRRVKESFDPSRILNPGRMVAGV